MTSQNLSEYGQQMERNTDSIKNTIQYNMCLDKKKKNKSIEYIYK